MDGKRRFIVKLNRLPPEFYPSVNGRDYLNSVIVRNKKLEENLEMFPEKKNDFHQRIHTLIDEGSLQFVGKWKDVKPRFKRIPSKEGRKFNSPLAISEKVK